MTLIEPSTTTTGRRKRRGGSTSTSKSAAKTSRGTRIVRAFLTGLWLLGVPLFAAVYVDREFGAVWGVVPQVGCNVASLLALVAGVVVAYVLHRQRAIFMLAAVPAAGAWIGYAWLGGATGTWLGLVTGLGAGLIAYAVRRQQGS